MAFDASFLEWFKGGTKQNLPVLRVSYFETNPSVSKGGCSELPNRWNRSTGLASSFSDGIIPRWFHGRESWSAEFISGGFGVTESSLHRRGPQGWSFVCSAQAAGQKNPTGSHKDPWCTRGIELNIAGAGVGWGCYE